MGKTNDPQVTKRDKSYRGVTEEIHDKFIAYCNRSGKNTGDTLSQAMKEYLTKHDKR